MDESYAPSSDFLCSVINDEAPLTGSAFAEANLARVIELMQDDDVSNRDWATFLVAELELDRSDVRQALLTAAEDSEECVRAEAILGLARRDRKLALPLVRRELEGELEWDQFLEAAQIVADPSLVADLERLSQAPGNASWHERATLALDACRAAS